MTSLESGDSNYRSVRAAIQEVYGFSPKGLDWVLPSAESRVLERAYERASELESLLENDPEFLSRSVSPRSGRFLGCLDRTSLLVGAAACALLTCGGNAISARWSAEGVSQNSAAASHANVEGGKTIWQYGINLRDSRMQPTPLTYSAARLLQKTSAVY